MSGADSLILVELKILKCNLILCEVRNVGNVTSLLKYMACTPDVL